MRRNSTRASRLPAVATAGEAGSSAAAEVKASSNDPAQAEREEKKVHGVVWGMSLDQARELAAAEKKPILIDFTGVNCANCRLMEQRVLPRPEIVKLLKEFVTVQLYTDFVPIASITAAQRKELAEKNQERQLDLAQEATNPFYVVLTPEGKLVVVDGGLQRAAGLPRFPDQGPGEVTRRHERGVVADGAVRGREGKDSKARSQRMLRPPQR